MKRKPKNGSIVVEERLTRHIVRSTGICNPHCMVLVFVGKGSVKFQGVHVCLRCGRVWRLRHSGWTPIAENMGELLKGMIIDRMQVMIGSLTKEKGENI